MKIVSRRLSVSVVGLVSLGLLTISGCTRVASPYVLTQTSVAGQGAPQQTELAKTGLVLATATPFNPMIALQVYASQTALAAANPALPGTPTPVKTPAAQPASPPNVTSTPLPNPGLNWGSLPVIGPILASLENLGDNPVVVAVISALLTLFVVFFGKIFAWLGRLLARLWSLVRMRGKDYEFERAYLDWMVSQHRHLGILPAQVVARRWGDRQQFVDLEDVFVRLSISAHSSDENPAQATSGNQVSWVRPSRLLQISRSVLGQILELKNFRSVAFFGMKIDLAASWYVTGPKSEPGSFGTVIERNRRLVLRGDPGSGKTTLLRYLAVTCARELRQNPQDGDTPHLVGERLSWEKRPFPILVKLSRHSNVTKWEPDHSLIEAIRDELPADLRKKCPPDFFEIRLKERPCLILLDAFDELGSPAARAEMAHRINGFLEVYEKPMHRVLVTTRIVGYEGQLNRLGFHIRTVQPLQEGDIRALVKLRYKSIGISETIGRNEIEAAAIQRKLTARAQSLIARIETTQQLRLLATNPLLLSLIVLVHFLKVELPDERILLYRDCVEILTERWQQYRREEAGAEQLAAETLTLTQKLLLLREIAYAMQQRKDQNNGQALIRKATVVSIIAQKLPEILGGNLQAEDGHSVDFVRYAEDWVKSIETSSGILVEQGLDQDGEPLIGFSHLTFQEYLTAIAVYEVPEYQTELWHNLDNPSWREVILLFVVLTNDATPVIQKLLASEFQPGASLLAGSCLVEKVRKVEPGIQARVIEILKELFVAGKDELPQLAGAILGAMLNSNLVDFLVQQISHPSEKIMIATIRVLGNLKANDPGIDEVRARLVALLEMDYSVEIKIAARETLSRIGDPRFIQDDPVLIYIPVVTQNQARPQKPVFSKLPMSLSLALNLANALTNVTMFLAALAVNVNWIYKNLIRNSDLALFKIAKTIFRNPVYTHAFAISKYPVTNFEYEKFINETNYWPPFTWTEGTYPQERGSYPVTGITFKDAILYCYWLGRKTKKTYRLPVEWEWEIAAGGPRVQGYPWGEFFQAGNANTSEARLEDFTPVGTFYTVESPYGLQDTCGNAQEYTYQVSPITGLVGIASLWIILWVIIAVTEWLSQLTQSNSESITILFSLPDLINLTHQAWLLGIKQAGAIFFAEEMLFMPLLLTLIFFFLILVVFTSSVTETFSWLKLLFQIGTQTEIQFKGVCFRGGSWREDALHGLAFFRTGLESAYTDQGYVRGNYGLSDKGFRVVRNLDPDEIDSFIQEHQ